MDNEKTYDTANVKVLIERFFEASILPEEMDRLMDVASCPDKFLKQKPDDMLAADLMMIAELGAASQNILNADTPPGLEQKLENHISRLSRKSGLRRKWIYSVSAAAAVAAILTVGLRVNVSAPVSSGHAIEAIADSPVLPPVVTDKNSEKTMGSTMTASASVSTAVKVASRPKKARKTDVEVNKEHSYATPQTEHAYVHDILPSLNTIPPASDLVADITPTLSAAVIDPAGILAQPISTLSQSMDNVYESIGIVARALAGVNASLKTAAEGLAPITDLQPHSI